MLLRTYSGRRLTSSNTRARYSPTSPIANRLSEPNSSTRMTTVATPRGALSGATGAPRPGAAASTRLSRKSTVPAKLSIVSGTLLNEKMPFLAQPMLRRRLFVVSPNMRLGRT